MEELLAWKRQCFVVISSARCAPSLVVRMLGKVACSAFLVRSIFKEFIMEEDFATNDLQREVLDDCDD